MEEDLDEYVHVFENHSTIDSKEVYVSSFWISMLIMKKKVNPNMLYILFYYHIPNLDASGAIICRYAKGS